MKILQLVPGLYYGDAVGNDVLALDTMLRDAGYETKIYALDIGKRIPEGVAEDFFQMPMPDAEDLVVYHMATGCDAIRDFLLKKRCRQVMVYHNLTPARFFEGYSEDSVYNVQKGFDDLARLRDAFESCIAVSEFNRQDLRRAGYRCPIAILPILVPFADYRQAPDHEVLAQYQGDGRTNILFLGRVVPNKCQEDILAAFAFYQQQYDESARLFVVGNYDGMERYYDRLQRYAEVLGARDVVFTGHTPFPAILAYYQLADAFLCMSEHEGFCVPLIEAMLFDTPVVAYRTAAIPYTLHGAGLLLEDKHPALVAAALHRVVSDMDCRARVLAGQRERLAYFSYERVGQQACELIRRLVAHESVDWFGAETEISRIRCGTEKDLDAIRAEAAQLPAGGVSFADVPIEQPVLEQKSHAVLRAGYRAVNAVSPWLAQRVKQFIKSRVLS